MNFRTGLGIDIHQFDESKKLFLGGVEVPSDKGLKGHSDADVLLHAICDALLGSLSLGDIGYHFPDTNPKYKNITSNYFLEETGRLVKEQGWKIANIDCMLLLEAPKIAKYIPLMKENIAQILGIEVTQVSIKATTSETLGFVGRQEGAQANAVVLIEKQ